MDDFRPGLSVDDDNALPVRVVGGGESASLYVTPKGYLQISSVALTAATKLTVPAGARMALVQNNGGSTVRWRDDGPAPTANQGMRIDVGADHTFLGDLSLVTFRDEGANAVLDVSFYG